VVETIFYNDRQIISVAINFGRNIESASFNTIGLVDCAGSAEHLILDHLEWWSWISKRGSLQLLVLCRMRRSMVLQNKNCHV